MSELTTSHARELARQTLRKTLLSAKITKDFSGVDRIFFEAGCGHGHWLSDFAQSHPDVVCVGIDLKSRRIRKCKDKKDKRGLKNIFFYKADLNDFLEVLPKSIFLVSTILIFPDPWPKVRHRRRRIVQPGFLDEIATRTERGGKFYFRSDSKCYFEWTIEHIKNHCAWHIDTSAKWPSECMTYFQSLMGEYFSLTARRL